MAMRTTYQPIGTRSRLTLKGTMPPVPTGKADNLGAFYHCGTCAVDYEVPQGDRNRCPCCQLRQENQDIRAELMRVQQQYDLLEAEYVNMRSHHDIVMAIRSALELTGTEDITFLKAVLYRWKTDRGVTLQVTHSAPAKTKNGRIIKDSSQPHGFLAMYRRKDGSPEAEERACSTAGGVAIAGYFEEAVRSMTHPHALDALARAMNQFLTGEVQA